MEENREEDGKKTVISMVTYLIANVIGMAVSLVALPVLTNLLSTAEMGIATSFITLKNIVTIKNNLIITVTIPVFIRTKNTKIK